MKLSLLLSLLLVFVGTFFVKLSALANTPAPAPPPAKVFHLKGSLQTLDGKPALTSADLAILRQGFKRVQTLFN
jgi:hypothetical protein